MNKVVDCFQSSFVSDDDGMIYYYQVVYVAHFSDGSSRVLVSKCSGDFFDNHADVYDSFYYDRRGRVVGGVLHGE